MSAEKIFFGAILAAGAIIALGSEPDAAISASAPASSEPRQRGTPIAAREISSEAGVGRYISSDCPNDPVSAWTADTVARLARCMSSIAPVQYENGLLLTGARSEGLTLILDMRHPGTLNGYVADHDAGATGLCQNPLARDLIGRGVAVRLTISGSDGGTLPSLEVDSCS